MFIGYFSTMLYEIIHGHCTFHKIACGATNYAIFFGVISITIFSIKIIGLRIGEIAIGIRIPLYFRFTIITCVYTCKC